MSHTVRHWRFTITVWLLVAAVLLALAVVRWF